MGQKKFEGKRKLEQKIVIKIEQKHDKQTVSMMFIPDLSDEEGFKKLNPQAQAMECRAAAIGKYIRDIVSTLPEDL